MITIEHLLGVRTAIRKLCPDREINGQVFKPAARIVGNQAQEGLRCARCGAAFFGERAVVEAWHHQCSGQAPTDLTIPPDAVADS